MQGRAVPGRRVDGHRKMMGPLPYANVQRPGVNAFPPVQGPMMTHPKGDDDDAHRRDHTLYRRLVGADA